MIRCNPAASSSLICPTTSSGVPVSQPRSRVRAGSSSTGIGPSCGSACCIALLRSRSSTGEPPTMNAFIAERRVVADGAAVLRQLLRLGLIRHGRSAGQVPLVRVLRYDLERTLLAAAADQDRQRPLRRLGTHGGVLQAVVLALVRGRFVAAEA